MGKLGKVWTDLPDTGDEESYKEEFVAVFGAAWDRLLVGAEEPFVTHVYWDGYLEVTGIRTVTGLTLADLAGTAAGAPRFNIVAG